MTTMTSDRRLVTGGVDTHRDFHVAAALDHLGGVLGTAQFPTTTAGYRLAAGLAGRVRARSTRSGSRAPAPTVRPWPGTWPRRASRVIEVGRPNRQVRRRHGKTDVVDAIAAGPRRAVR